MLENIKAKPVVKWVGGKTQLLEKLMLKIPSDYGTYYEPFVGGGALFFSIDSKRPSVLNDRNGQLINLYIQIRDNKELLIDSLNLLQDLHKKNPEELYYKIREEYNKMLLANTYSLDSAAYFLYLNKAGFNGLYRTNRNGLFNVPFNKKKEVSLYSVENIEAVSNALQDVSLLSGDFETACKPCKKGDFIFFDSPYYNTFDTYQSGGFTEDDHKRLFSLFQNLSDKGVYCMLTNSNEDFVKDLYKDYAIEIVDVKRMVNCDASKRTGQEIIVTNF